jgi:hypothetical protein
LNDGVGGSTDARAEPRTLVTSALLVAPATAREEASFRYITFRADTGQPEAQAITANR